MNQENRNPANDTKRPGLDRRHSILSACAVETHRLTAFLGAPCRRLASWLGALVPVAVLVAAVMLLPNPVQAQALVETVTGQPGVANGHAVVNFQAMAMIERMSHQTNSVKKILPLPLPRGGTQQVAGAAGPMPMAPAASPAGSELSFSPASGPGPGPSPPVATGFMALDDTDRVIPPDVGGAVGPNHVMAVHNDRIRIQDRTGATNFVTMTINGFWAAVGNPNVFDPKILYDPFNQRWMFTAVANALSDQSAVLMGVSQTSDPTGFWNLYRVDADAAELSWADYPSMGFNKDWIVVTVNMFAINPLEQIVRPFYGMNVYVFNKTNLYANGQGLFTVLKDETLKGFTAVPAITYDNEISTIYLVQVDNLLSALGASFLTPPHAVSRLQISTITGSVGSEVMTLASAFTPTTNAWFSGDIPLFSFGGSGLQLGLSFFGVDLGDSRIQNVVYRNGSLWCTHTFYLPLDPLSPDPNTGFFSPIHSGVQWWQLTPEGGVQQFGRIEDPSGTNSYAYPSIAVNQCNDVLIGYSSFSPLQYPSANYSFRFNTDPPNTLRAPAVLKAGEAPYFKTFGGFANRWGDYSSTVVDPVNDVDMWTLQEYAALPLTGTNFLGGRWASWWGRIDVIGGGGNQILFASSAYEVIEGGVATITVLNAGGTPGSVDYSTSDGTASGTLTFAAGQTSTNFFVPVPDDSEVNPGRTITLTLSNLQGGAVLGCIGTALLTIIDDESLEQPNVAGEFAFSTYLNYGWPYLATENESHPNGFCGAFIRNIVQPDRSAPGAIVTVIRTNGHTGRVLVDYSTEPGGSAVPGFDYTPVRGTLVFDDYQMSANFVVPVLSDTAFFSFSSFNFFKWIRVVVSNPRPAPEEELAQPGFLKPKLGHGSESGILSFSINEGILDDPTDPNSAILYWWNIERQNYRVDEYGTNGNVRQLAIDVTRFPQGAPAATVNLVVSSGILAGGQLYFTPPFPLFDRAPDPRPKVTLNAGSERAEAFEAQNAVPFTGNIVWANSINQDVASVTITNFSDYAPVQIAVPFGAGQCRRSVLITITNDSTVEFNEDFVVYLTGGAPFPLGPHDFATVTIMHDDPPAGALDREWNPDNASHTFPAFNTTPGADQSVSAVAIQADGKTVLAGDFTAVNGDFRNHIARMNVDGSLDSTFAQNGGADSFVSGLAVYPVGSQNQGQILIAGGFRAYDSFNVYGITRLLSNGSRDPSFNPGLGTFNPESPRFNGVDPIRALALQADGRIVVGGDFTLFNGVGRAGLARLNANGSLDSTFNPGAGLSSLDTVWALAVQPDGAGGQRVIVGGDFRSIGGQSYRGLARLNADGSVDTTFASGSGAAGSVYALAVQPDGRIVVAGDFSTFNERPFSRIVRLNANGSVDDSFDPGRGPNDAVFAVTLQPDGKPLIGGWFTSYDGTRRMGLARLYVNGTLDTSFLDTAYNHFAGLINDVSYLPANYVSSIAVQQDGNVMIGGSFTQVGGNQSTNAPDRNTWTEFTRADKRTRYNIARLLGGGTPGPGNASFDTQSYLVNENSGTASLKVNRTDGRLGTLTADSVTFDRLATPGADYVSNRVTSVWPEMFYMTNYLSVDPYNWTPVSVGSVEPLFIRVPILDDTLQEPNEVIDLRFVQPGGSVTLAGEMIPLGGALGRSTANLTIADNDVDHGIFGFSVSQFNVGEDAGQAIITVIRTNGSFGAVSVYASTFTATNGSPATAGSGPAGDYVSVVNRKLIFLPNVTAVSFPITINPDDRVEFDENIGLVLSSPTDGAKLPDGRTNVTATLTIIDADFLPGRVNFRDATYTTNEAGGSAIITVTRTGGAQGRVTVQYATTNGTAIAPADYTGASGTLVWNDNESGPRTFTVPLIADGIVDNATNRFESVGLRLFNPIVGAVSNPTLLGARTNATLLIEDADSYGTLVFSQPVYQADENSGSANISVIRQNGIAGTVSVDFSVTSVDSPVPGADYLPTNGVLTFLPGEIGKSFTITLVDDAGADGDKNLILTLANPTNAVIGSPNPALLKIVDNESFNIPAGELDDSFSTNLMVNGPVFALGLQPDGRIVVAGSFTEVNRVPRVGVARLTSGAALDTSLNPGSGPNGEVRTMSLQPDGKILLGGTFTQFNGTNRNRITRLNTDGTIDSSFSLGASFADAEVNGLVLQPDGKVIVAGSFTTFNGDQRPGFVRLHTNGVTDLTFAPGAVAGSGANGPVFAVALQPDGKVVIGGEFTMVQGQTRTRIARLHANGLLDSTFNPAAELNGAVRSLLIRSSGQIVAGGSFTTANAESRSRLAQFNADGTLDATFLASPLAGADNVVLSLAQQVDGKLLVGGDFRRFNGVTRNRLTRLLADGSNDPSINFGNGADSFIAAVALQPDRKILFGGGFSRFDDRPRQKLARIYGGSIAGNGSIEFARGEYLVGENGTNALITVRRRGGTTGQAGVNFTTADGTALAGVDYQTTAGTLAFPEAETRLDIVVPIIDNMVNGGDRAFGVELVQGTFTGGATSGLQPVTSVIILDDEGQISFSSGAYSVNENVINGGATITVQRRGGSNTTATVNFATADGSARAPADYLGTNGTITFLPGELSKNFRVPIVNDSAIEPRETVLLSLTSPSGSNVLGTASGLLTISDDEVAPGQLLLSSLTYQVNENGTNAVVTVLRTNGYTGTMTVNFSTSDGTAQAGQDYVATNGSLTFPDGESFRTIEVPILDDLLVEAFETFNVMLLNPLGGATLVNPSSATVAIVDNDVSLIRPAGSMLIAESVAINNIIDPNERVTLRLGLINDGNGDTPPLLATLQSGNGVGLTSGPQVQNYGVLQANGAAVFRDFSFTAVGNNGDRLLVILALTDGPVTNGFASFVFTIGGQASRSFTNSTPITINDDSPASPYPSLINVAGMGGTITKVTATLTNLSHQYPLDVDILLVGPGGERVMLISDAGGSAAQPNPVSNVTLTFDSTAANSLSATGRITSGTYRPANFAGPNQNTSDTFPPPAPQPTTTTFPFTMFPYTNINLAVFDGTSPNGQWSLFVYDDGSLYAGSIGGWSLTIQTSDPVSASPSASVADMAVAATVNSSTVAVGADIVTTFIVTNRGPATAESVALIENLPPGMSFISANASVGSWTKVQNRLTWIVGVVSSGGGASLTVIGRPLAVGTLESTTSVSANQLDPNAANNTVTIWTTVIGLPSLSITRQTDSVRIAWPASSGFKLQSADSLDSANWQDVGIAPTVEGSQSVVTVGVGASARFYRLRSP